MEMLRSSAASACILGIIFSVLSSMTPSDRLSKQINVIFSLVLIIVIAAPFARGIDFEEFSGFDEKAPEDYSYIYSARLEGEIRSNISENLGSVLIENGFFPLKISVDINNSADGSISINKAEMILPRGTDTAAARRTAAAALGVQEQTITVITEGE